MAPPERVILDLDIEPYPQGRHRTTRKGRTYPHPRSEKEKKLVRSLATAELHRLGLSKPVYPEGPLQIEILCWFSLPKYRHRVRAPLRAQWHTSKKDWDNLGKLYSDALNGILWTDDAQIAMASVVKVVSAQGDPAKVEICVSRLPCTPTEWLSTG